MNLLPNLTLKGFFNAANLLKSHRVVVGAAHLSSKLPNETNHEGNINNGISLEKAELMKRLSKKYLLNALPYPKLGKEEREALVNEIHENLEVRVKDQPMKEIPEIDPDSEPFNHIYKGAEDKGFFTRTENITEKDPDRWFWVERLLPKNNISKYPEISKEEASKQLPVYQPISLNPPDLPYFISRTRSGMYPVYKIVTRNDHVLTNVRKISGDVWKARDDILSFLSSVKQLNVEDKLITVNEVNGSLTIRGNHVIEMVNFLAETGF